MGRKLEGSASVPNFTPIGATIRYRTAKLKFLLRYDQNLEYEGPAGAYPLRDFHEICRVRTAVQDALNVKIWIDLLQGYGVMGL